MSTVQGESNLVLADVDAVEIKVTIRADQELRSERAMELNPDTADVRSIYFYDTPELELFNAGIILRARLVKGDCDDSTVKFRPVDAARVAEEWKDVKGFKLESDWAGERVVCSASLTSTQKTDEIDEVAKGERAIDKLFSKAQERFLAEFHKSPIDFSKLRVLGPIRVLRWRLSQKGFPHELTVEEWRLTDGDILVEVSIKTPPADAPRAQKDFEQHLRGLGLDPGGAQETKTRTVLEYFARTSHAAGS